LGERTLSLRPIVTTNQRVNHNPRGIASMTLPHGNWESAKKPKMASIEVDKRNPTITEEKEPQVVNRKPSPGKHISAGSDNSVMYSQTAKGLKTSGKITSSTNDKGTSRSVEEVAPGTDNQGEPDKEHETEKVQPTPIKSIPTNENLLKTSKATVIHRFREIHSMLSEVSNIVSPSDSLEVLVPSFRLVKYLKEELVKMGDSIGVLPITLSVPSVKTDNKSEMIKIHWRIYTEVINSLLKDITKELGVLNQLEKIVTFAKLSTTVVEQAKILFKNVPM